MKMGLTTRYIKRKFADGGNTDKPGAWDTGGSSLNTAATGAGAASSIIDTFNTPDQYGKVNSTASIGSSALKYGAMGASAGGLYGAAAGVVVGGVVGAVQAGAANKRAAQLQEEDRINKLRMDANHTASVLGANPEALSGSLHASYYRWGGGMKLGKAKSQIGASSTQTAQLQQALEQMQQQSAHHQPPADNKPRLDTGYIPNPATMKAAGGEILTQPATQEPMLGAGSGANNTNIANQQLQGGSATQLNANAAQFNGPTHEGGGIQVPGKGAETEGGETTNGSYVFSKQLGYAQLHKPIAAAIGKIEKKAMAPERINSLKLLKHKENQLRMAQENTRQQMGLN